MTDATQPTPEVRPDGPAWQRLSGRMVAVDAARTLLSLMPSAIAIWVVGIDPTLGNLWPVLLIAVFGTVSSAADVLRWIFTRYRVTDDYVERRTGVFVRRYRSVRRDRIRSVDSSAKLLRRFAGLRVVSIGAGQQATAGESALRLDAVTRDDAEALRRTLLPTHTIEEPAESEEAAPDGEVFARLRPWWVVYNVQGVWAFFMAAGLLWGGFWLATTFGIDVVGMLEQVADWETLGWGWTIAAAIVATGAVGVIGMAANFFTENWGFELARVPAEKGTVLRTRRGLFHTREVNRDDNRLRGITVSEPVVWRWMGMADTNVITTGLGLWATSQPTTILPRGPVSVARPVAGRVLGIDPSPLDIALPQHPRAALRRRMWWATWASVAAVAVLAWVASNGALSWSALWYGVATWPLALLGAAVAYRALGHTIVGDYAVVRSGLLSRATTALRRDAVSTIAVRESVLQRRLGLRTVSLMTAAGWSIYQAPDVETHDAVVFALDAAPGLLAPFVDPLDDPPVDAPADASEDDR